MWNHTNNSINKYINLSADKEWKSTISKQCCSVLHLLLLVTNRVMEHCTCLHRCIFFNVYKKTKATIQKYSIEVLKSNNAAAKTKQNKTHRTHTFYWWIHSLKIEQRIRMKIKKIVHFEYIVKSLHLLRCAAFCRPHLFASDMKEFSCSSAKRHDCKVTCIAIASQTINSLV